MTAQNNIISKGTGTECWRLYILKLVNLNSRSEVPGVLRHVKGTDDAPLMKGKRVTSFRNSEDDALQLTDAVPFLLEDMLKYNQGV